MSFQGQYLLIHYNCYFSYYSHSSYEAKYSRMEEIKFVGHQLQQIWSDIVVKTDHVTSFFFFKTLLFKKQILLGPFSNNLFHMIILKSGIQPALRTQPAITCSKLTIETLEQVVKYVQS